MTPEAIEHLSNSDKRMAELIGRVGPCTIEIKSRTPFQALVIAVTHQQLNGTAAATILKRVRALFPRRKFPTPAELLAMPDHRLRAAGLSRAKTIAVKDIASKTIERVIPGSRAIARMSEEEIMDRLITIRGVGPWTIEMLLIFTLGRTDVFPVTDYGVRKGFARTFGWKELPTPRELLAFGERWRPHRSTAAWYFWRALEAPA